MSVMNHDKFFDTELEKWPMAADNFVRISNSLTDGQRLTLSGNGSPWRIDKMVVNHRRASVTAKTDPSSISSRPCFLCRDNRPPQQSAISFLDRYEILVNPYPLARRHFTIASIRHEEQCIDPGFNRIIDMAQLACEMSGMCIFYNGARCGASAPDHFHFQAVSTETIPNILSAKLLCKEIIHSNSASLYKSDEKATPFPFFIIESTDNSALVSAFRSLWNALKSINPDLPEPDVNIAMTHDAENNTIRTLVIPRGKHRPACYYSEHDKLLVSPATVEMLGTIICPRREDFDRLTLSSAYSILKEVGISDTQFNLVISLLTGE